MDSKTEKWTAATCRYTKELAYWTAGWVISCAVASFGPKFIWNLDPTISAIAIFVSAAIGAGMILANKRYLNGLDEMQRKISLEAMAIALGVGVVGGLSYSMLDIANIVSYHAEISHLVILIGISYLIGIVVGNIRYK